jgi:hypothetical protein
VVVASAASVAVASAAVGKGGRLCTVRRQYAWKRNKKVAIKPGFEGVRERIVPWN